MANSSAGSVPENVIIIGMDPPVSKNCGWAVVKLEGGKLSLVRKFTQVIACKQGDPVGLEEVYHTLESLIKAYGATVLCMERQMGGGVQFARAKLNEFVGVAKLCCHRHGLEIVEMSPGHLKLIIASHGHAPKEKIMSNVVKTFGLTDPGPEHECDAAALGIGYLIDKGWQGYVVNDPYTKEEQEADKVAKAERKKKREERAAKKEADKLAKKIAGKKAKG